MQRSTVNGVKAYGEELYSCFPEPDPDYVDEEEDSSNHVESDLPPPPPALTAEELSAAVSEAYDLHVVNGDLMTSDDTAPSSSKEPPLIKPKPLHNPCLESKERQALHRELLMNYKIGKDVLQKPELNKVLRERREKEKKKEWDELKSTRERTSLVMKLEERANKLKEDEEKKTKATTEETQASELTRIQRRIMQKSSGSSEQT
ncbi:hypothetical protein BsWGS_13531 [Bradybaena similaris]